MSTSWSLGDASVRRYIEGLCLRSSGSIRSYRLILSGFLRFLRRAGSAPLSVAVIQEWLRDAPVCGFFHAFGMMLAWSIGFSTGRLQHDYFKVTHSPSCEGSTFREPRRRLCEPSSTLILRRL